MTAQPIPVAAGAPQAAGSSFYIAMRVLPAAQREAMFRIYAFCRAVDDIADGDGLPDERRALLERWRSDIHACFDGAAPPGLAGLAPHIAAFGLARADFLSVIDGMMMDAGEPMCAPEAATLDLYCDRVASAVGRLSVRVFGMEYDDGVNLAHHLGRALQLTNILRDIDEDAQADRVYLPREALLEAGVEPRDARTIVTHPALAVACASLANEARADFRAADRIMRLSPRHVARAPRIMGAAYQALLARLVARGWRSPRVPVRVPQLQRFSIVLRHGLF